MTESFRRGTVHPTAIVSGAARLGANVTIGAFSIVNANVELGDDSVVSSHCVLGEPLAAAYATEDYDNPPLTIGRGALIRSGTALYAGSSIGERFECGHRVTIREGAIIGDHCRVGTLSDIQGHCRIGRYVRLHSNVHVGHRSSIADFVWIFPYVVLTNDPHPPSELLIGVTLEEFSVVATMSVVLPGVTVGRDALVGASSLVRKDVPPGTIVAGNPAREVAAVHDVRHRETGEPVYPWRYTFDRGMPWEGIGYEAWVREGSP